MKKPLNIRQLRFCEFIAAGMSGTDAWIAAGYQCTRPAARANAAEALAKPTLKARIAELRAPQTKRALLAKDRKREILREIAEDRNLPTMVRIRAIEIDAKLAGHFEPDRLEVETGPKTLEALEARAANVVSALDASRRIQRMDG